MAADSTSSGRISSLHMFDYGPGSRTHTTMHHRPQSSGHRILPLQHSFCSDANRESSASPCGENGNVLISTVALSTASHVSRNSYCFKVSMEDRGVSSSPAKIKGQPPNRKLLNALQSELAGGNVRLSYIRCAGAARSLTRNVSGYLQHLARAASTPCRVVGRTHHGSRRQTALVHRRGGRGDRKAPLQGGRP